MAIDSRFYVHESDRIALEALQAIPGFTPLLKAFMKVWSEKQYRIQNMSTNLRLSEKQLPKYYHMLPPICEKLGIEVPELYLELNVTPNAYTAGDTKPFIVMTSGLLESMPEELIPTVLAHECGHIACRHVLYHTMGQMLLSGALDLPGVGDLIALPLQLAFFSWMRSSEFSADRAAALCDGTGEKMARVCMCFAGLDKRLAAEADLQEFMNQALEYRGMMDDSKFNKTLEFLMFSHNSHPLNAVRAYECTEWTKTDDFANIRAYVSSETGSTPAAPERIPLQFDSRELVGMNCHEACTRMYGAGFRNIRRVRDTDGGLLTSPFAVMSVSIDGSLKAAKGEWFPPDAPVILTYYQPLSDEEQAAAHPGQCRPPESSILCLGKNARELRRRFAEAGFTDVRLELHKRTLIDLVVIPGAVTKVSIGGDLLFGTDAWFDRNAPVVITHHPG